MGLLRWMLQGLFVLTNVGSKMPKDHPSYERYEQLLRHYIETNPGRFPRLVIDRASASASTNQAVVTPAPAMGVAHSQSFNESQQVKKAMSLIWSILLLIHSHQY